MRQVARLREDPRSPLPPSAWHSLNQIFRHAKDLQIGFVCGTKVKEVIYLFNSAHLWQLCLSLSLSLSLSFCLCVSCTAYPSTSDSPHNEKVSYRNYQILINASATVGAMLQPQIRATQLSEYVCVCVRVQKPTAKWGHSGAFVQLQQVKYL